MSEEQRQAALTELDALLSLATTGPLDAAACQRVLELSVLVPGRMRRIVNALGQQRDAAAVDVLLALPTGTPGVVEAVFAAIRHGVARERPDRVVYPRMLALEFRSSNARRFPLLLERAVAAFGDDLERIRVEGRLRYRLALIEQDPAAPQLLARVAPLELDIESLHRDLARLRGVRLWLNGWRFDDHSNLPPPSRAPLLRAWFESLRSA
ncbi:hypothetical protein DB30_04781 [Enhygromyxa salina]|uniref:Uncharacterized protein n=1 Tax=Enhygromyxa salina TaxID=215803 RepID=A0A0C2CZC5_9BACT|nr:hypothetical protein [Enhygromyxa salina]KIG16321.1 hypothetical protein DB30_04781 [Enhygromyxa salina]